MCVCVCVCVCRGYSIQGGRFFKIGVGRGGGSDPFANIFNFTRVKNLQIPCVLYFSFLFLVNGSPLVIMKNAFYFI